MKKITIWDIIGDRILLHIGSNGWECFVYKAPGQPEHYQIPQKYTKDSDTMHDLETRKILNASLKGVGAQCRAYVKGLKILLKNAYTPGFFEIAAGAYKKEDASDLNERFKRIIKSFSGQDNIIKIGMGSKYGIIGYVDGSFEGYIKESE